MQRKFVRYLYVLPPRLIDRTSVLPVHVFLFPPNATTITRTTH